MINPPPRRLANAFPGNRLSDVVHSISDPTKDLLIPSMTLQAWEQLAKHADRQEILQALIAAQGLDLVAYWKGQEKKGYRAPGQSEPKEKPLQEFKRAALAVLRKHLDDVVVTDLFSKEFIADARNKDQRGNGKSLDDFKAIGQSAAWFCTSARRS